MIQQNLYDFIVSHDSRYISNRLTERKTKIRITGQRKQQTIKVVERILNRATSKFDGDYINHYETKLQSVAENKALDFPSADEEIFLNLGRESFIDKLFQAYYVFTRHEKLFAKLVVDNSQFFEEVEERLGHTHNESLTESERLFVRIVDLLSYYGPRSLGGRDHRSTLKGLRFSVKRPNRAKKKQFRRGYQDKGSLAPQHVKEFRKTSSTYFNELEGLSFSLQKFDTVVVRKIVCDQSGLFIAYARKAGYNWTDDEVIGDSKRIKKIQNLLSQWCTDNSLDEVEVSKDLNRLLRRG